MMVCEQAAAAAANAAYAALNCASGVGSSANNELQVGWVLDMSLETFS